MPSIPCAVCVSQLSDSVGEWSLQSRVVSPHAAYITPSTCACVCACVRARGVAHAPTRLDYDGRPVRSCLATDPTKGAPSMTKSVRQERWSRLASESHGGERCCQLGVDERLRHNLTDDQNAVLSRTGRCRSPSPRLPICHRRWWLESGSTSSPSSYRLDLDQRICATV